MKIKIFLVSLIIISSFAFGISSANAKARIYQQETKTYICYGETTTTIYTRGAVRVKVSRAGYVYYAKYKGRDKFGVQKWEAPVKYGGYSNKKITIRVTALSKKGKNASAKIRTLVKANLTCP